jgi:hypothetical protein
MFRAVAAPPDDEGFAHGSVLLLEPKPSATRPPRERRVERALHVAASVVRSAEAAHLGFGVAAPRHKTEPRVHDDRTERSRDEGIEVHLSELRDGVGHPGNT